MLQKSKEEHLVSDLTTFINILTDTLATLKLAFCHTVL